MTADLPEIIRATAPKGKRLGFLELLNINFIESGITVVFHPEYCGTKQVIIFYQFYKADSMDLFSTPDYFISSMGINILDKVR
jgi:hypothetical protein